jgi:hypothetical protein
MEIDEFKEGFPKLKAEDRFIIKIKIDAVKKIILLFVDETRSSLKEADCHEYSCIT